MPSGGVDLTIDEKKMLEMSAVFRNGEKQLEEVAQSLLKQADTMEKGAFEGAAANEYVDALKSVAAKNTIALSKKLGELAADLDQVVADYKAAVRRIMANKG